MTLLLAMRVWWAEPVVEARSPVTRPAWRVLEGDVVVPDWKPLRGDFVAVGG